MSRHVSTRPGGRLLACGALLGALAACADRAVVTHSTYPRDHRERHPIVIADGPKHLDVFVIGPGGLSLRQSQDVRGFAEEYRKGGNSALSLQVPSHTRNGAETRRTVETVRSALRANGVPAEAVVVRGYLPTDPSVASPIRLSFQRLEAKVPGKCGLWPQDLGVSDYGFNLRNEPYWNLGCATQSNFAAQIDDPIDLVRGRSEGRIDTMRRGKDIDNLRQGKDPSTQWRQDEKGKINTAVGN